MIGGVDVLIPTRAGDSSIEVAVRAIRQKWPQAAFENSLTGERYGSFRRVPFGKLGEIFVYRDTATADAWDAEGAVPVLSNTMIHLIADADAVTVVVDEKDAEMQEILAAIVSGLSDQIHYLKALKKAA